MTEDELAKIVDPLRYMLLESIKDPDAQGWHRLEFRTGLPSPAESARP